MSKKKKWNRDRCTREYITDEDGVSLRALAVKSGVSYSTLSRWSMESDWVNERIRYKDELKSKTTQKTIDSISDRLAESYTEIAVRHFNRYKKASDLADQILEVMQSNLAIAIKSGDREKITTAIEKTNINDFNLLSLVSDRSCKGEASSIGLKYEVDNDALVKVAESLGYTVVESSYLEEMNN